MKQALFWPVASASSTVPNGGVSRAAHCTREISLRPFETLRTYFPRTSQLFPVRYRTASFCSPSPNAFRTEQTKIGARLFQTYYLLSSRDLSKIKALNNLVLVKFSLSNTNVLDQSVKYSVNGKVRWLARLTSWSATVVYFSDVCCGPTPPYLNRRPPTYCRNSPRCVVQASSDVVRKCHRVGTIACGPTSTRVGIYHLRVLRTRPAL